MTDVDHQRSFQQAPVDGNALHLEGRSVDETGQEEGQNAHEHEHARENEEPAEHDDSLSFWWNGNWSLVRESNPVSQPWKANQPGSFLVIPANGTRLGFHALANVSTL